jgi:oxygen-independent coproporphyrinogen-3 oxidase
MKEDQKINLDFGLPNKNLSLYIHIPFCELICPYCDFNKYSNVDYLIEGFVESLLNEIEIRSGEYTEYDINSIFFGGGTPSYLDEASFSKIVEKVKSCFKVSSDVEFSIEINPSDLNKKSLKNYSSLGINRISVGGQSFNDNVLLKLGRNHNSKDLIKTLNLLKSSDINNINLDLIFGVPGQSLDQWKHSLDKFIEFEIPHISTYCLTFEPKTRFYKDLIEEKILEPEENLIVKMFNCTSKILNNNGYNQYEISNWSKSDFECKHNLRYWMMQDYLGFGPGSSSLVNGERSKNIRSLKEYIKKTSVKDDSIKIYTQQNYLNNNKDNMFEYIMLNLRLKAGINHNDFLAKFKNNFFSMNKELIEDLIINGLIKDDKYNTSLTTKGIMVSDEISRKFIQKLV